MSFKTSKLISNLEDELYDMVVKLCNEENTYLSVYLRTLVIEDLLRRGMLDKDMLIAIAV